jgi:hypothetical protein
VDTLLKIDLFEFCTSEIKCITFLFTSSAEILHEENSLSARFDNACAVPNTRTYHGFVPIDNNSMKVYRHSSSVMFSKVFITKVKSASGQILNLKVNDYVACINDANWWLGTIVEISVENMDYLVNFFHPCGPDTKFKKTTDRSTTWVPHFNILRVLSPIGT